MLRLLAGVLALCTAASPVLAQNLVSSGRAQTTPHVAANSYPSSQVPIITGAGTNPRWHNEAVREQDSAKIAGLPGAESGPAVTPSVG